MRLKVLESKFVERLPRCFGQLPVLDLSRQPPRFALSLIFRVRMSKGCARRRLLAPVSIQRLFGVPRAYKTAPDPSLAALLQASCNRPQSVRDAEQRQEVDPRALRATGAGLPSGEVHEKRIPRSPAVGRCFGRLDQEVLQRQTDRRPRRRECRLRRRPPAARCRYSQSGITQRLLDAGACRTPDTERPRQGFPATVVVGFGAQGGPELGEGFHRIVFTYESGLDERVQGVTPNHDFLVEETVTPGECRRRQRYPVLGAPASQCFATHEDTGARRGIVPAPRDAASSTGRGRSSCRPKHRASRRLRRTHG